MICPRRWGWRGNLGDIFVYLVRRTYWHIGPAMGVQRYHGSASLRLAFLKLKIGVEVEMIMFGNMVLKKFVLKVSGMRRIAGHQNFYQAFGGTTKTR